MESTKRSEDELLSNEERGATHGENIACMYKTQIVEKGYKTQTKTKTVSLLSTR